MKRKDYYELPPEERISRTLDTIENLFWGGLICFLVLLIVFVPVLLAFLSDRFSPPAEEQQTETSLPIASALVATTPVEDTYTVYPTLTTQYTINNTSYSFLPVSFIIRDTNDAVVAVQVGFSNYRADDGYTYWANSMVVLVNRYAGTTPQQAEPVPKHFEREVREYRIRYTLYSGFRSSFPTLLFLPI